MAKYAHTFFIPDNIPEILPELSGRVITAWQFEELKSMAFDSHFIARHNHKMADQYYNAAKTARHDREYWMRQGNDRRNCALRHAHLAEGRIAAVRNAVIKDL